MRVQPRNLTRRGIRPSRKPRARRLVLEALEERATPTGGVGCAFALGAGDDDIATKVATDSAGDVYVAGSFRDTVDFDPGPGVYNMTSIEGADLFLAKYSSDGSLVWAGQLAGGNDQTLAYQVAIAIDAQNNVYMTGEYSGTVDFDFGPGVSTLTATSTNNVFSDAFVAKYTSDGALAWAKSFGGDGSPGYWYSGKAITVDDSGNVYTVGSMNGGTLDLDPGPGTFLVHDSRDSIDTYISKLDSSGNFVWGGMLAANPATLSGVWSTGIAVDASQDIYITGIYEGTVDFDPGPGTDSKSSIDPPHTGGSDGYVLKLTSSGSVDYFVSMGGTSSATHVEGIALDTEGNAYVTGLFTNTITIVGPDGSSAGSLTSANLFNGDVIKLDPSGNLLWADLLESKYDSGGRDIAYDGSGSLYVTGGFSVSCDFDPGPGTATLTSKGSFDAFVLRLDTDGGYIKAEGLGGPSMYDLGFGIAADDQGNVFTVGRFADTAYFNVGATTINLTSAGHNDAFVVKLTNELMDLVNHPPVAADQTKNIDEDTKVADTLPATDIDGDMLTYAIVTQPEHGRISSFDSTTGAYTYLPGFNYNGPDSFQFKANDGQADSNVATVSITVNPVNDAPLGYPIEQTATTQEDTPVSGQATARDFDNDPVTFSADVPEDWVPQHGSFVINPDGAYTYTPAPDFNGTDILMFKVTDDKGAFGYGAITVSVTAVNDAPSAGDDAFEVQKNGILSTTVNPITELKMVSQPGDYIGQGSDSGTKPLTFDYTPSDMTFSTRTPTTGVVTISLASPTDFSDNWSLTFASPDHSPLTPAVYDGAMRWPFQDAGKPGLDVSGQGRALGESAGWFIVYDVAYGSDDNIIRFAASFEQQGTNTYLGTVDPPLTGYVVYNSTFGASGGVLANDSDVDGDSLLSAQLVNGPSHGSLSLNSDGTFTYTPDAGFVGIDSFTYQTSDGLLTSPPAKVSIKVNGAPEAADDSWTAFKDHTLTVPADRGVLGNDSDPNGDPLSVVVETNPAHGSLTLNPDGSFSYTPESGFSGTDSFSYKANDGQADSNVATVTLSVKPLNRQATAQQGDYDGDGKADIMVYRPETATFYVQGSASGETVVQPWGWIGHDQPVIGDYDGDGKTDFAVFRPDDPTNDHASVFYVLASSTGQTIIQPWGSPDLHDQPLTGDFDGDGKTDFAVFRPGTATYHVKESSSGETVVQQWGWIGHDRPLVGDYDGDGKTDFAVFRPDNATFYVKESSGGTIIQQWGWRDHDRPLTGDFDGDGKTDFAVFRPETATYHIKESSSGNTVVQPYGWVGHDRPLTGDYDGDGKTDYAVFRPDDAIFYVRKSSEGKSSGGDVAQQWGWVGHDRPVLANSDARLPVNQPGAVATAGNGRTLSVATAQRVEDILDRYDPDGL